MGVLNHLITPRRPARQQLSATLRSPLGALLLPQLERLGASAGELPARGPTGSAWSRAYILGAACASLQHQPAAPSSDLECFGVALTAFAMTYGEPAARTMLAETVAAAEAREPEVEDGLLLGAADLALVASAGAEAPALHFATRNRGELIETI